MIYNIWQYMISSIWYIVYGIEYVRILHSGSL